MGNFSPRSPANDPPRLSLFSRGRSGHRRDPWLGRGGVSRAFQGCPVCRSRTDGDTGAGCAFHWPDNRGSLIRGCVYSEEWRCGLQRDALAQVQTQAFETALRGALRLTDRVDRTIRLREILRGLSAEQIPVAFERAKKLARSESWEVLSALGSRWAEIDPRDAFAFGMKAGKTGPYGGYNSFLDGVMEKWSNAATSEAISWVQSLPPGETRNNLFNTVITTVGQSNPEMAVRLLRTQANYQGGWVAQSLFYDWAGRDPQAAATAALDLKGNTGRQALNSVARSWAQDDPRGAMQWANGVPNVSARKGLIDVVAQQWAEADPQGVITWARGLTDESMRRNAIATGISRLTLADPAAALVQIHELPEGEDRNQAVIAAAGSLADKDARSAVQLLDQLAPGPQRNDAINRICNVWGQSEPRAALDWLLQNTAPSKGGFGISRTLQTWLSNAPADAIAWAQALPAGDNRDAAMASVVAGLASTDFARAQLLFGQLSPDAQATASQSLTYNLLQQDTTKAKSWAESLPAGKAQTNALGLVARQWADQNPTAAAQWLGTLDPGAGRDRAVSNFSNVVFNRDPDGALAWAVTTNDPKDRDTLVESLVRQWLRSDSTAARNWLNTSQQVTPELKTRILNR